MSLDYLRAVAEAALTEEMNSTERTARDQLAEMMNPDVVLNLLDLADAARRSAELLRAELRWWGYDN